MFTAHQLFQLRSGFLLLISAVATPAFAAELTPMLGYTGGGRFTDAVTEAEFRADESRSWGLILGWDSAVNKQYELLYNHQSTDIAESGVGLRIDYLHIGGNYFFAGQQDPWSPFVAGGLGVTRFDLHAAGDGTLTRLSMSLAAGTRWRITEHLGVRLEVRGYGTLINSASELICDRGCNLKVEGDAIYQVQGNVGISYRF